MSAAGRRRCALSIASTEGVYGHISASYGSIEGMHRCYVVLDLEALETSHVAATRLLCRLVVQGVKISEANGYAAGSCSTA